MPWWEIELSGEPRATWDDMTRWFSQLPRPAQPIGGYFTGIGGPSGLGVAPWDAQAQELYPYEQAPYQPPQPASDFLTIERPEVPQALPPPLPSELPQEALGGSIGGMLGAMYDRAAERPDLDPWESPEADTLRRPDVAEQEERPWERPYTKEELFQLVADADPRNFLTQMIGAQEGPTVTQDMIGQFAEQIPTPPMAERLRAVLEGTEQLLSGMHTPADIRREQERVLSGERERMFELQGSDVTERLGGVVQGLGHGAELVGNLFGNIAGKVAEPLFDVAEAIDEATLRGAAADGLSRRRLPTASITAPALLARQLAPEIEFKPTQLAQGLQGVGDWLGNLPGDLMSLENEYVGPLAGRALQLKDIAGKAQEAELGVSPDLMRQLVQGEITAAQYSRLNEERRTALRGELGALQEKQRASSGWNIEDIQEAWRQGQERWESASLPELMIAGATFSPLTYVGGAPARMATRAFVAREVGGAARQLDDLARATAKAAAGATGDDAVRLGQQARLYEMAAKATREGWDRIKSSPLAVNTGEMNKMRSYLDTVKGLYTPMADDAFEKAYTGVQRWAQTYAARAAKTGETVTEMEKAGRIVRGEGATVRQELGAAIGDIVPSGVREIGAAFKPQTWREIQAAVKGKGLGDAAVEEIFPRLRDAFIPNVGKDAIGAIRKTKGDWLVKKINLVQQTPAAFRAKLGTAADEVLSTAFPNLMDDSIQGAREGWERMQAFIFHPEQATQAFGVAPLARDGRFVSRILRDFFKDEDVFVQQMGKVQTQAQGVTTLQSAFDLGAAHLLPDPKRNPIQIFASIVKNGLYSPVWLGTRPGYVIGNLTSNLWAVTDGGLPRLVGNDEWYRRMGLQGQPPISEVVVRDALKSQGIYTPSAEQLLDMRERLGREGVGGVAIGPRHARQGIGATGERPRGGMNRLFPLSRVSADIESTMSAGYYRRGVELFDTVIAQTIPVESLRKAGMDTIADALVKAAPNVRNMDDLIAWLKVMSPDSGELELWKTAAAAAISDIRTDPRLMGMGNDFADILADALKNPKLTYDDWVEATNKAYKQAQYMAVPQQLRQKIMDAAEKNVGQPPAAAYSTDELDEIRKLIDEGHYRPRHIEYIETALRRDYWINRLLLDDEIARYRALIASNIGEPASQRFGATWLGAANKASIDADSALAQMDNLHAQYRGQWIEKGGEKVRGTLPDGRPGALGLRKGGEERQAAWIEFFEIRDKERFTHFDTWGNRYGDLLDNMKREADDLMQIPGTKAAGEAAQQAGAALGALPPNTLAGQPGLAEDAAKEAAKVVKDMLRKAQSVSNMTETLPVGAGERDTLIRWAYGEAQPWLGMRRMGAMRAGEATRDFAILNYADKRNVDALLAMFVPFSFWQTRQYSNLFQRVIQQPSMLTAYARYKQAMESATADMPPEYRGYFGVDLPLLGRTIIDPTYPLNMFQAFETRISRAQAKTPKGEAAAKIMGFLGRPYPPFAGAVAGFTETTPEAWQSTRFLPLTPLIQRLTAQAGVNKGLGFDPEALFRQVGPLQALTQPLTGLKTIGVSDDEIKAQLATMLQERQAHPVTKMGLTQADVTRAFQNKDELWQEAERQAIAAMNRYDIENPKLVAQVLVDMIQRGEITLAEMEQAIANKETSPLWAQAARELAGTVTGEKLARFATGVGVKAPPTAGRMEVWRGEKAMAAAREPLAIGGIPMTPEGDTRVSDVYRQYPWLSSYYMANDTPAVRELWRKQQQYREKSGPLYKQIEPLDDELERIKVQREALKGKDDDASKAQRVALQQTYMTVDEKRGALYDQIEALRKGLGLERLQVGSKETMELARTAPQVYARREALTDQEQAIYAKYEEQIKYLSSEDPKLRRMAGDAYAKRQAELQAAREKAVKEAGPLVYKAKRGGQTLEEKAAELQQEQVVSGRYDVLTHVPPGSLRYRIFSEEEIEALDAFYDVDGKIEQVPPEQQAIIERVLARAASMPKPTRQEADKWQVVKDQNAELRTMLNTRFPNAKAEDALYWAARRRDEDPEPGRDLKGSWDAKDAFAKKNPLWAQYYRQNDASVVDRIPPGTEKYDLLGEDGAHGLSRLSDVRGDIEKLSGKDRTDAEKALRIAATLPEPTERQRAEWKLAKEDQAEWWKIKEATYPGIAAKWDAYNAAKKRGEKLKIDAEMQAYLDERNAFAKKHMLWAKYYQKESTFTPGIYPPNTVADLPGWATAPGGPASGLAPSAPVPGYLQYALFPGGKPSSTIASRLARMYRSGAAGGGKKSGLRIPKDLAERLFGRGIFELVDYFEQLPQRAKPVFLDRHPEVRQYFTYQPRARL